MHTCMCNNIYGMDMLPMHWNWVGWLLSMYSATRLLYMVLWGYLQYCT